MKIEELVDLRNKLIILRDECITKETFDASGGILVSHIIKWLYDKIYSMPMEYFCKSCGQLRLDLRKGSPRDGCGNCGSIDLIIGDPGSLNKEALKRQFKERKA